MISPKDHKRPPHLKEMSEPMLELDILAKQEIELNNKIFQKSLIVRGFHFILKSTPVWRGPNGAKIDNWVVKEIDRNYCRQKAQDILEALDRGARSVSLNYDFEFTEYTLEEVY